MALVPVSEHRWRCCRGRFHFRQRTLIGYQSLLFSQDFFYCSLCFNFEITFILKLLAETKDLWSFLWNYKMNIKIIV